MVDTTLPIGSSTMDTFCSLMGSRSEVIDPLAPSITSTPLGKAGPREGQTNSSDSRYSSALLFASSSFNLPGFPSVGLGSLTPSVPSITGSHHISSTWPPNSFPSRPSTPWLTIDQANSIFGLASECQALSVKLAAWKKMHEVMYNHQLEYDWRLSDFLKEAEMTLANMRDQIWTAVHALMESEGMTFEDCLSLMLCILPLLLQIPVDISYEMQILLTIAHHLGTCLHDYGCSLLLKTFISCRCTSGTPYDTSETMSYRM